MASDNLAQKNYFSIIWSINNFSCCWHKKGEYLSSPSFRVDETEESKWKLFLFLCGVTDDSVISLCLYRKKDSLYIKDVDYMIQFLASDGTTLDLVKDKEAYHVNIDRNVITKNRYFPRDMLKLCCRITLKKETSEIKKLFFQTLINVEKISSLINIEKFSNFTSEQPQCFSVKSAFGDIEMRITITVDIGNEGGLFMNICCIDEDVKYSTLKIFIMNCNKVKVYSGEHKYSLDNDIPFLEFPLNCSKSSLINHKNLYLPNDVLTLLLEFEITRLSFNEIYDTASDCSSHPVSMDSSPVSVDSSKIWRKCVCHDKLSDCPSALITDLASLQNDQNSSDMKLQTKTNIYHVHTLILGARSPVFQAMFSSEMIETVNGIVDVSDFEDETIRQFLTYLYTDQLGDLIWEDAQALYNAADKYDVISLKNKCSLFLINSLQPGNVCKVLEFSELHQEKNLKISAQNYILENAKEILKSEDWKILLDTNSKLAIETMSRNWMEE